MALWKCEIIKYCKFSAQIWLVGTGGAYVFPGFWSLLTQLVDAIQVDVKPLTRNSGGLLLIELEAPDQANAVRIKLKKESAFEIFSHVLPLVRLFWLEDLIYACQCKQQFGPPDITVGC